MTQKTKKAVVTQVQLGIREIEGLLLPDGQKAVTLYQAWEIIDENINRQKNGMRQTKSLLGKGFKCVKVSTEIAKKPTSILYLKDFELLLAKADRAGFKNAQDFRDDLVGVSLEQEFSRAFGEKFEEEDFQQRLEERQRHRTQYHPLLTIWLQRDGCVEGWQYGRAVNIFKSNMGLPLIPVDQYDRQQLLLLNRGEIQYDMARQMGATHERALEMLH